MAADSLGIFDIETPQQVQARLKIARAKELSEAASPIERRRTVARQGLASLFQNKEVDRAKQMQTSISLATKRAEEMFQNEGITDKSTQQLLRLEEIRKEFAETNPSMALKLEDKIRELRVKGLEEQKLRQELKKGDYEVQQLSKRYIMNPNTLQEEEVDISTEEGYTKLKEAQGQGWAVADNRNALVNIFNSERARQFTERQSELDRIAKKQEDAAEKRNEQIGLTQTRRTAIQGSLQANRQLLDKYEEAASIMRDERVMDIMSRVGRLTTKAKDLLNIGLTPQEQAAYLRATRAIANLQGAANELLREQSGAAVTDQEWERAKVALPNMEDSPEETAAKMENMYMLLNRSNARMNKALEANDYRILDEKGDAYASDKDWIWGKPTYQEELAAKEAAMTPAQGNMVKGTGQYEGFSIVTP